MIVIFILIISISFMVNTSGTSNTPDIVYFILGFAFFFLNLFILAQFAEMSLFFIEILSYSQEISKRKAIALLVTNLLVIVITLFRYFVHG